jgi:hypothetical protein
MTLVYATERKEVYVLRKLQRGLSAIETWYEHWNIKINNDKTQATYFSHRLRPPDAHLTLIGRNIYIVIYAKYFDVIFDKRITWKTHLEMIEVKVFTTFNRIHFLFKSESLSTNVKLTLHKALIRSEMAYSCPAWEISGRHLTPKIAAPIKNFSCTIGNIPTCTSVNDLHTDFNLSYVRLFNKIMQATSRSHTKSWEWTC